MCFSWGTHHLKILDNQKKGYNSLIYINKFLFTLCHWTSEKVKIRKKRFKTGRNTVQTDSLQKILHQPVGGGGEGGRGPI